MASLSSLPVELVLRIYDFLDPGSHLDFSLISKYLAHCSQDLLKHHRHCYAQYRMLQASTHDGTLQALLQTLVKDEIAAWHVRRLELTHVLETKWSASPTTAASQDGLEKTAEKDRLWTDRVWATIASRAQYSSEAYESLAQIASIEVEASALLHKQFIPLIGLCPKLRALQTVPERGRSYQVDDYPEDSDRPVAALSLTLLSLAMIEDHGSATIWPGALRGLRRVSIADHRANVHSYSPSTILPFFMLPAIETVHLSTIAWDTAQQKLECQRMFWPEDRKSGSTVQNIIFEHVNGRCVSEFIDHLLRYTPQLSTAVFNGCNFPGVDKVVRKLGRRKLETLIFRGDAGSVANNGWSFTWDCLEALNDVRVLTVDMLATIASSTRRSEIEQRYKDETQEQFFDRFVNSVPKTVEVLIIQEAGPQRLNDDEMEKVAEALVRLVKAGRCPKLTTIYADNFEFAMRRQRCAWGRYTDGGWLRTAKETIKQHGVTMYNQDDAGTTDAYLEALLQDM
ncbi:uncharacterized protein LTR77_008338 [Saxophila tyrrhenica]|uniref:F-box domain-containing protein n=1 Tax=Saxophila tyrrhenica TaxID=1690608 RepID=A0AAV9P3K6_9PEZI|nr:hypothetical protein LTR77_008338 [Saxophila tyrrhenica]